MFSSELILLGTLATSILAIPFTSNHVLHERRENPSEAWVKRDRVDGSFILPVRIGMTQSNLDKGHDLLMEVSRPSSPRYGQHYTVEEVTDLFAPSESTVDAIRHWLTSSGIDPRRITQSVNKQWMQFDAKTQELESLIHTKFHAFEHTATGSMNIACDEYHIPAHIQQHVDYITPGIKLLPPSRRQNTTADIEKRTFGITSGKGKYLPPLQKAMPMTLPALLGLPTLEGCGTAITPKCIQIMYNVSKATLHAAGNELGIFESLGDVYSQTDLDLSFAALNPNIPLGTHPKLQGIDGGVAPTSVTKAGAESNLDFQISYPLIYPQNSILFQTDDPVYQANYVFNGFLNTFLDALDGSYCTTGGVTGLDPQYPDPAVGGFKGSVQCGVYEPTNVISVSYGGQEIDLPVPYQRRQCQEFMKLGLQGVSVVFASGDSGVAGPTGSNSPNGCLNGGTVFSPDFPATCPYITTVGATSLPAGAKANAHAEVAVTSFPSGGGFSNIYATPDYQQDAVASYLQGPNKPTYPSYQTTDLMNIGAGGGIYNSAGRAYPDVSAVGDNVVIFNRGQPILIGGTSASAPVFASLLNRINEERLAKGKRTIGFVNPALYAHPEVFNDITMGSNPGCNTNGFATGPGWDPVTGLGTPNYPAMLNLFMGLS
ncbi:subtilisin-like protein [Coleophoma cylindrospora]|uniref:Subtilisin-like protein n=1 Tax=Coleophoma cylindrospora TaxID=1849047 RepID=A0A3D8R5N2_9HELO|nr:subtilisin-like protein [Coleophoma cylindrospora]